MPRTSPAPRCRSMAGGRRVKPAQGSRLKAHAFGPPEGGPHNQRRERQRKMKNDEARPSPGAAREEFFPGV
jgi:hypothetical protein